MFEVFAETLASPSAFIDGSTYPDLPGRERERLAKQRNAMLEYAVILGERIKFHKENIT